MGATYLLEHYHGANGSWGHCNGAIYLCGHVMGGQLNYRDTVMGATGVWRHCDGAITLWGHMIYVMWKVIYEGTMMLQLIYGAL